MKITKQELHKMVLEELEEIRLGSYDNRGWGKDIPDMTPDKEEKSSVEKRLDDLDDRIDTIMYTMKQIQNRMEGPLEEEEKENWPKKAAADIEKKGTEGEFTKYCGGDVTQACVNKAAKGSSTKRKQQAAFAANVNSHDDLTYPKEKAQNKEKK